MLLTGEPGAGKTAAMAAMATRHLGALRYFVRRDGAGFEAAAGAKEFLLTIGHQLAAARPELFDPERLRVVVDQHVGEVSGSVIGVRVGDLLVSPFRDTAIEVSQQAGRVTGELVGLSARRAVAEPRLLDIEVLQQLALLAPARALARDDPSARILVLLDGLDELRFARGGADLLGWLRTCPPLPPSVRFVLSSRPEPLVDVLRTLRAGELREIAIGDDAEEVASGLALYARGFAEQPPVAEALQASGMPAETFVQRASAAADGNFQYLAAFFRAIRAALSRGEAAELEGLLDFGALPSDLRALYARFVAVLRTELADRSVTVGSHHLPAWEGLYSPLLGALAVAGEPMTPADLHTLVAPGFDEAWVTGALARLEQFVERSSGGLMLYHRSFAEHLTAPDPLSGARDVDPAAAHARLATAAVERERHRWAEARSAYAIRQTPTHLLEAVDGTDGERARSLAAALGEVLADVGYLETRIRIGGSLAVDALLRELSAAVPCSPALEEVRRVLDREAPTLRTWDPEAHPGGFAQQVALRAVDRRDDPLARAALRRLAALGVPHVVPRWRRSQETPAFERSLVGHPGGVTAMAFGDDEATLFSADESGVVRAWQLDTGAILGELSHEGAAIAALVPVADGQRVLTAASDGRLRAWDPGRATADASLDLHAGAVTTAIAARGNRVLTGGEDGRVCISTVGEELEVVSSATGHRGAVTALAASAGAELALSAAADGDVVVWDVGDGHEIRRLRGHSDAVAHLAVTPDGTFAVSSSDDATVRIWDVGTGECLHVAPGRFRPASDFVVRAATAELIALAPDGNLDVWDLAEGAVVARANPGDNAGRLALAPGGDLLLAASMWDPAITVMDLAHERYLTPLAGHVGPVRLIVFAPSGTRAVTAAHDGVIRVWDPRLLEELDTNRGHSIPVAAVAVDGEGAIGVSGDEGTVRTWALDTGEPLARVDRRQLFVTATAIDGSSGRVVTGHATGELLVLPLHGTGDAFSITSDAGTVSSVAVTPDGRVFSGDRGFGDESRAVREWTLGDQGRELRRLEGHGGSVQALAVVPAHGHHDMTLLSGSSDGTIRRWDLSSGRTVAVLEGHAAEVFALAVTADGSHAVTADKRGWLRVWDLSRNALVAATEAHDGEILGAAVAAGGAVALTGGTDGRLRAWRLPEAQPLLEVDFRSPITGLGAVGDVILVGEQSGGLTCGRIAM